MSIVLYFTQHGASVQDSISSMEALCHASRLDTIALSELYINLGLPLRG
jgi:hypothetical protein